ncbi:CHAT domain-containing protein [Russula brevipes]|nr:CHAT domain-containing protein [Russula brevipes]
MAGTHDILRDVSADIERFQILPPFVPRSDYRRPWILALLGSALYCRYLISRKEDDLLTLIPLFTEALLLPLSPAAARFLHATKIFYKLACSLAFRFQLYGNPEDLEQAVKYYRYILDLPPAAVVEIDVLEVVLNLTNLLVHMVQMGTDVKSGLAEEVIRIFRNSAALDSSSGHVGSIAKNIGIILLAKLNQCEGGAECEQVLKLFGEVERACPSERSPEFCVVQGIAFSMYFQQTSLHDHSEKAIVHFNKALTLLPPEHNLRPLAEMGIATVLHYQFTYDKQLGSLEEAIHHSRVVLSSCPPGHVLRPACLALLSGSLRWRYAFFGNAESLQEADSCVQDALNQELPESLRVPVANAIEESNAFIGGFQRDNSLEALTREIRLQQQRLARKPPGHSDQLDALLSLAHACGAKFQRTNELADLEEEINYLSIALAASPPDSYNRRRTLSSLGIAFQRRFWLDKGDENYVRYLDESIKSCRGALELCPRGQMSRFEPMQTLAVSLSLRSSVLLRRADFDESMELFRSALDDEYAHPHARYKIASQWASCAHAAQHPATAVAYETAISLVQSSLALGPTLEVQHRLLRGNWGLLSAIPLNCAAYHIGRGSLAKAVESLERGRALLWSEMRGLRTPMDELRASNHTTLARRFAAISDELENITTLGQARETVSGPRDHTTPDDLHTRPDRFSQMMENVRRLEHGRGEIIGQIRLLPGFEDFLKAVPFEALQTAAACGPVIVINHCRFRSDIIIVLHNSPPVLIPTSEEFYPRATELKDYSMRYQRALRLVLRGLYELIGRPVLEKLRKLRIREQSRVWWCPTSVFCSLPLHAAGPIETKDGVKRYFSDVYVSSYTPTLSALIESRKGITDTPRPPSLLIVGQPDPFLPGVEEEIDAIQSVAHSTFSLIGSKATRATVLKHLPNHRMAHFACHGKLEAERPFDTALLFRGNERLTLLDIVRSRLSTAEFAFLSVCHAAEWTDEHTPDEALHLTAAMQYCGFRSAVGTMWAMADTDGRELSEYFYGRVFADEERRVPIGERTARALRDSVQKLRRKEGITLERWVNFVHYGA